MTTLYTFKGGIDLPQQSDRALDHSILNMPLPERLVLSLLTRRGTQRRVIVNSGDSVVSGQALALDDSNNDVPLLASADAVVEHIATDVTPETSPSITLKTSAETSVSTHFQPAELDSEKLHRLGIQGLGGAAFSSFTKLKSCTDKPIETLIINAAECEPLICCDQALIREHCADILPGIERLLQLSGARHCVIGIEDSMTTEIDILASAIDAMQSRNINLVPIPTRYPTGSEKQLIQVLTGKSVPANQLPRDTGVLCFNIATAFSVKRALLDNKAQVERIVTVTGTAVNTPRNIRIKFGTPLVDILTLLKLPSATHSLITMGGPISGIQVETRNTFVSAATNCLVIDHPVSVEPETACIRCGECDKVCPANLLPQQLHWFCRDENLDDAEKFHLSACIECGCCDYVCPSNIALTSQFRDAKYVASEQKRTATLAIHAQTRFDARAQRLERKEKTKQLKIQQRKDALDKKRASRKPGVGT